jgi:hypothetical protein
MGTITVTEEQLRAAIAKHRERSDAQRTDAAETADGSGTGDSGTGVAEAESGTPDSAPAAVGPDADEPLVDVTAARAVLDSIFKDFSTLRDGGRSPAWAELENRAADKATQLILAKLISPKDMIGLLIDIEQFRKEAGGTQRDPGDWLSEWLSDHGDTKKDAALASADIIAPKKANKHRGRKLKDKKPHA